MSQVIKLVVAAVVAVVALLLVTAWALPHHWKVTDSVVIHAPAERIHGYVDDLREWSAWAYHAHPDQTLQTSFSGPARGVGARRDYEGQHAGRGFTTIVRSEPASGVWFVSGINVETPNARGSITYDQKAGSTVVTWTDEGELPFFTGAFLRDSVQQGLQKHMASGLSRLKALAEAREPQD